MQSRPGWIGAELAGRGRTIRVLVPVALVAMAGTARAQDAGAGYETVVESPRPPERAAEDEAASASVLSRDRTPRSGETLPQLLSELPGVTVTRLGGLGALATLSLRGSAANQVAVYVDGVPLNSAVWGGVDVGALPIADVDRIEVYRGMSPTAFGSSAIGGIVSLESRAPEQSGLAAYAGGGSFRTGFGGAQASWAGRRVRLYLGAHYLGSRGDFIYYDDNHTPAEPGDDEPNRVRENNGLQQLDGLARAAVPLAGRRQLLATLSFFGRDKGLAPYGSYEAQGASLGTRRFLGSVRYDSRDDLGPGGRLRVTAYGSTTQDQFRDLHQEFAYQPTSTRDRSVAVGTTANGSRPVAGWLRLSATLDGRHEEFMPFDLQSSERSGAPGTRSSGALAAEAHALLGGLEVLPSLRLEAAHDEVIDLVLDRYVEASRPETHLLPIARLALLHRRSFLTLRANAGRYARVPTLFERYGNDGFVRGNPALVPESSLNADAGISIAAGAAERTGFSADAAIFGSRARDLIDLQEGRGFVYAANVGRARILGAELAMSARWRRYARFVGQGTFTDTRDTSDIAAYHGRQLALRPRWRGYARPEVSALPLPFGWRAGAYGEAALTGGNYRDPSNRDWRRRRLLFGAGASLESRDGSWRLVWSAQNLGGVDVVDLVGFPQPRRSFFLTLAWSASGNSPSKETVP